jgi:hypothetical protein
MYQWYVYMILKIEIKTSKEKMNWWLNPEIPIQNQSTRLPFNGSHCPPLLHRRVTIHRAQKNIPCPTTVPLGVSCKLIDGERTFTCPNKSLGGGSIVDITILDWYINILMYSFTIYCRYWIYWDILMTNMNSYNSYWNEQMCTSVKEIWL